MEELGVDIFAFLLQNHLHDKKFQHRIKLVNACRIFLKPSITFDEVNDAHSYLIEFGEEYENIYGSTKVTPNIHAHCHIKECILDHGGVYSTWIFGFKRDNGTLAALPLIERGRSRGRSQSVFLNRLVPLIISIHLSHLTLTAPKMIFYWFRQ